MKKKDEIMQMLGFDCDEFALEREQVEAWIEKDGVDAVYERVQYLLEHEEEWRRQKRS